MTKAIISFFKYMLISIILLFNNVDIRANECKQCHFEQYTIYGNSIHAKHMECSDCHNRTLKEIIHPPESFNKVNCNICHDTINKHGSGSSRDRPNCYDCHSKHLILPSHNQNSSVNYRNLKFTCKKCHEYVLQDKTYLMFLPSFILSSHIKQNASMAYDRYNCIGCHQGMASHGHKVSITNERCSNCHKSIGKTKIFLGSFHKRFDILEQPFESIAGVMYQLFILISIVIFVLIISKTNSKRKKEL